MKKFITSLLFTIGFTALVNAESASLTVLGNTMTNLLSPSSGSIKVTQVLLNSGNASGTVTFQLIDNTTNSVMLINPAYTNTVKVLTNLTEFVTNYYGVIWTNSYTNVLQTVSNNVVAASTNAIQPSVVASVTSPGTAVYDGVSYYFRRGLWVTNTSASNATVTITYQK